MVRFGTREGGDSWKKDMFHSKEFLSQLQWEGFMQLGLHSVRVTAAAL